jgi:Cu-processing system permease protein
MLTIAWLTFKNVFKDRIALIILSMVLLYVSIPVFSSFSMRQIQEVSITMSLTLNSFILLFLSIFGATATIWRDIERKFVYTILSYPIKRSDYLIGRFLGFALVMLVVAFVNFILSIISIHICSGMYKSRLPILWDNIALSFALSYLQYILLMAFGFLFASFSTSFFTPFFATVSIFIAGNASQGIYDYVLHTSKAHYSALTQTVTKTLYYIVPNFSSFDLTAYAAYALRVDYNNITSTLVYFVLYFTIVISLTNIIFNKRDLV